jgi:hypothetical protein
MAAASNQFPLRSLIAPKRHARFISRYDDPLPDHNPGALLMLSATNAWSRRRAEGKWDLDVSKLLRRLKMMPRLWGIEKDVVERLLKESVISTLTERSLRGNMRASFRFCAAALAPAATPMTDARTLL